MKVELMKNGKPEIVEVNNSFGNRLLEQGKARLAKKEIMNPPESDAEENKTRKARKGE